LLREKSKVLSFVLEGGEGRQTTTWSLLDTQDTEDIGWVWEGGWVAGKQHSMEVSFDDFWVFLEYG
jgi:hypothetical protein